MASIKFSLLFISTLFLTTTPLPSLSFSFSQCQSLFSLSHSVALRVSNLRAARGDVAGAARARFIAHKLQPGLGLNYSWIDTVSFYEVSRTVSDSKEFMRIVVSGTASGLTFWHYMWSLSWDYLRNYSWIDKASFYEVSGTVSDSNESMRIVVSGTVLDLNELMRIVIELMRINSGGERAVWVQRNYGKVLGVSKSLFGRLSKLYYEVSGTVSDLNELMRTVNELSPINSGGEIAVRVQRNYGRVLGISMSLFGRLSKLFYKQGPLREVVFLLQREVVDGELLRDCLELASDLNGLIQIVKDLALQFSSVPNRNDLALRFSSMPNRNDLALQFSSMPNRNDL